jgi:DNA-binding PadR family transcriptional regulator
MYDKATAADQSMGLSATSAALLGQLAWREQSSYELVKAMGDNVRFFWPRAESHVYREVKRLTATGLATGARGATGRRPRTTYRITPAGRDALAEWLAQPAGGVALEHEPLLRVFLATSGSRADLLRAIGTAREQAQAMLAIGDGLADLYLAGEHPFQKEVHVRALTFDYLYSWARFTVEWADRAEADVRGWRDLRPTRPKHRRALARLRAITGRGQPNPGMARRGDPA